MHSGSHMYHTTRPNVQRTVRLQLNYEGTRADTTFLLSAKRTNPFKSAGASVQLTTGSRGSASAVVMLDTPCSEVV